MSGTSRNAAPIVITGYILLVLIGIAACIGLYYLDYSQRLSTLAAALPLQPTATLEPHIKPEQTPVGDKILQDDFSDNHDEWTDAWPGTNVQSAVQGGALTMKSLAYNRSTMVTCTTCQNLSDHFYLQADLTTDQATDISYGVVFQLPSYSMDHFYAYLINTKYLIYYFYGHTAGDWFLLASGQNDAIRPYPGSNTLGLFARQDTLEFYVNGTMVDTYQQTDFSFKGDGFGFYIDGAGPQLSVRNLLVYATR